jgi:hypothetical protein
LTTQGDSKLANVRGEIQLRQEQCNETDDMDTFARNADAKEGYLRLWFG